MMIAQETDGRARLMPGVPHGEDGHPLMANWYEFSPPLPDADHAVRFAVLDARGFYPCDGLGLVLDGSHCLCKRRGLTNDDALAALGAGYHLT
ncbi:hypothetical protein KO481_04470 [Nocardia sp. NEAU-G5]|uniref:Uncharacterized protein n=1 Tax=Nocardia albiluteola TaxID=2842303 RepID=A0ABS6AUR3_9NOCA|nr:hypothetical protein [Nocardia albiluteola]MBU3060778.1 hypothetical protein [Nocardia albiluteola]